MKRLGDIVKAGIIGASLLFGKQVYSEEVNPVQETQITWPEVESKIKNKEFNSYEDFINEIKTASEENKLEILTNLSSLAYRSYDINYKGNSLSQDDFLLKISNYLNNEEDDLQMGVCRHIASNIEKIATDSGMIASAVTTRKFGIGHVIDLIKTSEGLRLIDSNIPKELDTRNVERILEEYQKEWEVPILKNMFFNQGKLEYILIPDVGKKIINFIGYDRTDKQIEEKILKLEELKEERKDSIEITKQLDNLKKEGIEGNSSIKAGRLISGRNHLAELVQIGIDFEKKISEEVNFFGEIKTIGGEVNNRICIGTEGGLEIYTTNSKGVNFYSKAEGCFLFDISEKRPIELLLEGSIKTGLSYSALVDKNLIKPYAIMTFNSNINEVELGSNQLFLEESKFGVLFQNKIGNNLITINPFFAKKLGEDEVGGTIGLENKDFNLTTTGSASVSNYAFCPDKIEINTKAEAKIGGLELGLEHTYKMKDYDGEKEGENYLSITGKIKY